MNYWLKYEYEEIQAIKEAFETRSQIESKLFKMREKFTSDSQNLKLMEQGNFPIKALFKSKESKDRMIQDLRSSLPH